MVAGFTFWLLQGGKTSAQLNGAPSSGLVDLPVWLALSLTLVAAVVMGLVFEYVLFRPLRRSPPLAKLIGSLGLLLVAQAGCLLAFGGSPYTEPAIISTSASVAMFGTYVPISGFILSGIVAAVALVLWAVYRWTFFGLATRAAAENEASAMLVGVSPNRVSLLNSVMACTIAAALGCWQRR